MRQYALGGGGEGIRANAINDDRIRSASSTTPMIQARATARGVSTATYMAGNLLGQEVAASDVAEASLPWRLCPRTTGACWTGGWGPTGGDGALKALLKARLSQKHGAASQKAEADPERHQARQRPVHGLKAPSRPPPAAPPP